MAPRGARRGSGARASRRDVGIAALLTALTVASAIVLSTIGGRDLSVGMPAWDELDQRWGAYLSERQWGNPRHAQGGDGWGLSYLDAIRTEYRFGDDGIAGLTDRDGEFRVGWAFWDGEFPRITERLLGLTNPQGEAGETILDQRVFRENTPTASYVRYEFRYPHERPRFAIELEAAKLDSSSLALRATARNIGDRDARLDVVLKGWLAPGNVVDASESGLLLRGADSVVAIAGAGATSWQVSGEKRALDANLRSGGLANGGDGHIGALAYLLQLAPGASGTVDIGLAEGDDPDAAAERARELREGAGSLLEARRTEADGVFTGEVSDHAAVYRQALMSLLWSQSHYRWDGSGYDPAWAGRVDADEVLIMPDKWEFPWVASWDSGFHAVTAALIDPQLGADQIRFLLSDRWQQPDGHVPCAEWVMDAECPPVFAWSAWQVHELGAQQGFLEEVYPGLQRLYDYWWDELAVEPDGLFTGGFLGMDNLPRAEGRAQADASGWMAFFARHLALIADELGDADSAARYRTDIERIADAVNAHLWHEESGFYYDLDLEGKGFIRSKSYSGLVPLIAGIVPPDRVGRLLAALSDEREFLSPYGLRSVSASSVIYEPGYAGRGVNSNWRGTIWVPLNYLLIHALSDVDPALASDIRERVVEVVETDWEATGRFHEYFHAETGEGLGADAQAGWTALVANLIVEGWPAD